MLNIGHHYFIAHRSYSGTRAKMLQVSAFSTLKCRCVCVCSCGSIVFIGIQINFCKSLTVPKRSLSMLVFQKFHSRIRKLCQDSNCLNFSFIKWKWKTPYEFIYSIQCKLSVIRALLSSSLFFRHNFIISCKKDKLKLFQFFIVIDVYVHNLSTNTFRVHGMNHPINMQ